MKTNETMEQYIHKFSHELRGPLAAASGTLQLLERKYPNLAGDRYLLGLSADLQYMEELLSDFTRCFGRKRYYPEQFSLSTMLKECALSFAASVSDSSIQFSSHIPMQEIPFWGDRIQLKELVHNLLKNSLDATLPSGEISLDVSYTESHVILTISDTGCGISKDKLSHIFEPYVTYKPDGCGLGLCICKQIVTLHHGSIEVDSIPDRNTTFRITLPTKQECEDDSRN